MAHEFCDHLDEYGAQYTRTEASYRHCVDLVERIMSDGPNLELIGLVTAALQQWAEEDQALRAMLVAEVRQGRVLVPTKVAHHGGNRSEKRMARRKKSAPICTECHFQVPRLEYPEWQIAHNGQASFRGQELPVLATH